MDPVISNEMRNLAIRTQKQKTRPKGRVFMSLQLNLPYQKNKPLGHFIHLEKGI